VRCCRAAALILAAASVGCSNADLNTEPTSTTRDAASSNCDGDALAVVKTFVAAVHAGDTVVYEECELSGTLLSADVLQPIATGTWLIDSAAVAEEVPPPTANAVVIRVPAPDQPGDTIVVGASIVRRPPRVSALLVTATPESNGKYYVTNVVFSGSS
jgi:hypothetical protein